MQTEERKAGDAWYRIKKKKRRLQLDTLLHLMHYKKTKSINNRNITRRGGKEEEPVMIA